MECPKCNNTMNPIEDNSIAALKCTGCHGIWFKDGSHEQATASSLSVKIDSEPTNAAAAYNSIRDINCPECKEKLMKMNDRTQLHIEYEACSNCRGIFFDAGEFTDYTEFTFLERVKQTIQTLKTNL